MKTVRILVFVLLVLCIALTLTACGDDDRVPVSTTQSPPHTHSFGAYQFDTADHWQICNECGQVNKDAHSFNAWIVLTPATATTAGVKSHACSVCGYTETESIPAVDCTNHQYGAWTVMTPATATSAGVKSHACSICGYTETESIPAIECINHHYGAWTVLSPATATSAGVKSHVCSICGFTETAAIPAVECTDHQYGAWTVLTPSTSTSAGVKSHTCSICGFTETAAIPAVECTDHQYGAWTVLTPSTSTSAGVKSHTCSVCGYTETAEIPITTYRIIFNLDGGSSPSAVAQKAVTGLNASDFFFDVKKDGFFFRGWTYNNDVIFDENGNLVRSIALQPSMTFVALWSDRAKLTIVSDVPGAAELSGSGEYAYNTQVNVFARPHQGYEFVGWYYNNTVLSTEEEYNYKMWDRDVTLTARFKLVNFQLSLNVNYDEDGLVLISPSGSGNDRYEAEKTASITYTKATTISAFTKSDVRFLGWFDEDGALVTTNAVYTFPMPNHDYSLTAKWSRYAIQYELNGGTNHPDNPETYTVKDGFTLETPTRQGYTFAGWSNGGTIAEGSSGDKTFTANWTPIRYTITYNLNDGTLEGSTPTSYTIEDDVTLLKPTRDCYRFLGWYDAGGTQITNLLGHYGDLALSARWECYITLNDSGAITGVSDYFRQNVTTLVIPTSLNDVAIKSISASAFANCTKLTSLTIPDSVTSIGSGAFKGCSALESITIPFVGGSRKTASNTYQYPFGYIFGTNSYTGGTATTQYYYGSSTSSTTSSTYYIPSSLRYVTVTGGNILYGAFYGCSGLTSVTVPDDVTSIGNNAFYNCSGLTSVTVPDGVTSIGNYTFYDCINLTSIIIPDGVTSIGNYAFYNCSGLTSVTIPDGVTSIGDSAFYNCSGLTSVTIPDSVTSIGSGAFSGCSSLVSITIPFVGGSRKTASNTYQYPFGYIFGTNSYTGGTATTQSYYGSSTNSTTNTTYYIPSSLRSVTVTGGNILCGAFYNCSRLTSITIPDGATSIGNSAFYSCSGLTSVTLPSGVTGIGNYAFYSCSGLSFIIIPEGVTSIGNNAFYNCSKLSKVCNLSGLNITAGSSANGYVGYYAKQVYSKGDGTLKVIDDYLVYDDETDVCLVAYLGTKTDLVLPSDFNGKAYVISESAFSGCANLTSITVPDSITSIGSSAFSGCSKLQTLIIGKGVSSLPSGLLSGCSSLESLTIPFVGDSRKTEDDTYQYPFGYIFGTSNYTGGTATRQYYFGNSTNSTTSTTYYIPSSLRSVTVTGGNILRGAFEGCSGLTSITIPDNVTSIGNSAFSDCSGLTSITIPDRVTSIGDYAFSDCTKLTLVTIPDSVTSIGGSAFSGCSGLTSVTIGSGIQTIPEYAFYGCSGLTSVTIGSGVTSIEYRAFDGCDKLIEVRNLSSLNITAGSSANGYVGYYAKHVYKDGESCLHETADGYLFYDDGTDVYLVAYLGTDTELTLPNKFNGKNYAIYKNAFYGRSDLTSVTIPDGVTSIGGSAFYGCSGLTSVTIGSGVTSIEYRAFYGCTNLTSVAIPNGVTSIGDSAFYGCSKLQYNTYDNGMYLGNNSNPYLVLMKALNTSITSCTIHENTKIIYQSAFSDCTKLTSVTIPDSVTSIGGYAFYGCSGLTSVTIPDSVTSIGNYAFQGCSGLTSVTIGSGVTSIEYRAFDGCDKLIEVRNLSSLNITAGSSANGYVGRYAKHVYKDGESYLHETADGYLFYDDGTDVCLFVYYGTDTELTLPDKFNGKNYAIYKNAFYGRSDLTSVTIPNGVTSIGDDAFYGCSKLQYNTYDNGMYLGNNSNPYLVLMKALNTSITSCTIHENTKIIYQSAFSDCTKLTSVTIPDSVTSIGGYAFYGCSGLTSVTIPDSVTSIGNYAFQGCDKLIEVRNLSSLNITAGSSANGYVGYYAKHVYKDGESYLHETADGYLFYDDGTDVCLFVYYGTDTELTLPDKFNGKNYAIYKNAFYGRSGLTSITIPSNVTSIGYRAFAYCSQLKSATFLSETVPEIGGDLFASTWDASDFSIYVPAVALNDYKAVTADYWQGYAVSHIKAIPN